MSVHRPGPESCESEACAAGVEAAAELAPAEAKAPAAAATLPDLTEVPEGERDAVWRKHYYRGDQPQLTLRAVLMGGLLGMVMSISNLYTTLKLGWAFGVAITACVLSFGAWKALRFARLAKDDMTILENNCMQSTASAAGYSTGGTLATAVGALLLLQGDGARMGFLSVGAWVFFVAALGVFLAIPMKRQMINSEQLAFPSGIAAAETLRSLYAKGDDAVRKAWSLLAAGLAGVAVAILRSGFGVIPEAIPFAFTFYTVRGVAFGGSNLYFNFEPSLLLIAAGMIVGLRISTWMLIGSLINYLVLMPMVLDLPTWVGQGSFFGEVDTAFAEDGAVAMVRVTRWSLWLGTALLVSSGLTSFALGWRTILRAFQGLSKKGADGSASADPVADVEVPVTWLVAGGIPITIGLTLVCIFAFDIAWWLGIVSVVLSFVLALVACRATGETDTTPIGAMGKITQFTYALLAPGNQTVNLMTAGITAGAAGSSADLLTDLKSGYLLGANPRKQFIAQFIGIFFGVIAVVPMWYVLVPNQAALEAMHPPATEMWRAVAQALSQGVETIPSSARLAIVIGALVGIVIALAEGLAPKKYKTWVPSSMGLGLAFVVPFQNSFSFFIGAVLAWIWQRAHKESAEKYLIPIASGAVAGESLAAAGLAIREVAPGLLETFRGGGAADG